MPKYLVEMHDGRKFQVEADTPPSETDILAALGDSPSSSKPVSATSAPKGVWDSYAALYKGLAAQTDPKALERTRGAMPMGGALIGSLVGGPGGAAVGGMIGKDLAMRTAGQTPTMGDVAWEGAKQGALDATGAYVVGPAVKMLGRGVYGAGATMLPKTLKQEFPNIAAAGFREGIPLTGRGANTAGQRAGEVSGAIGDKLQLMDRLGMPPVDVASEVVPATTRTAGEVAKQPLRAADEASIAEFQNMLRAENPHPLKLVAAHEMKRSAQKLATQGYKQIDRGAPIQSLPLDLNMDVARGLREAIEQRAPSVAPMNARIQDLMGLERAGEHAAGTAHVVPRGLGALALGSAGGWIPAAVGMAATTPQGLTLAGLGLKGVGTMAAHEATPQAIRLAALIEALSQGR